jgi:hypothetical protein
MNEREIKKEYLNPSIRKIKPSGKEKKSSAGLCNL